MPFEKGVSGNPNGRPKGSGDKRTELRSLLDPHAPELVKTVVEKALSGDMTAMRLCLDRCIPSYKNIDASSHEVFSDLESNQIDAELILGLVGHGCIDLNSGLGWMQLLRQHAELTEIKCISERLASLEESAMN